MNPIDIIVICIIAGLVIGAVILTRRNKKCGSGCDCCSYDSTCNSTKPETK